jgi:hypothetical protein
MLMEPLLQRSRIMQLTTRSTKRRNRHFNDNNALIPEYWAAEGIKLLWEEMMYGGLVHRNYENMIAKNGETVHINKPGRTVAKRKQNDLDSIVDQSVSATDVELKLNMRIYNSFLIGDGERSKSMLDLFNYHLVPAIQAVSSQLDKCVGGQVYQFLGNTTGQLGGLTSSNAHDYLMDARGAFNARKVSQEGRMLGLGARSETFFQKQDLFKSAERRGDGGMALRRAMLGYIGGFDTFLGLNTPSITTATTTASTTTTANTAVGATVVPVTAVTNIVAGSYFTVAGDMTPLRCLSISSLNVTTTRALKFATTSGAVVQPYATALINQGSAIAAGDKTAAVASGYPAGWYREMEFDGTGVPVVGQLVSFKTAAGTVQLAEYCIVDVTGTTFMLDRPLEEAFLDNAIICLGPNGDFNFAFQKNCLALVNRPMALPPSGAGAVGAITSANGFSLRVVFSYDSVKQATRCTIDSLFGMKVLDTDLAQVMLA